MRHGASIQRVPCPLHRLYGRFGCFAVLRVCKKSQKTAQDVSFTNQWPQQVHEVCAKKPRTGQERNAMSKQSVHQKRCYMSFTCAQGQASRIPDFATLFLQTIKGATWGIAPKLNIIIFLFTSPKSGPNIKFCFFHISILTLPTCESMACWSCCSCKADPSNTGSTAKRRSRSFVGFFFSSRQGGWFFGVFFCLPPACRTMFNSGTSLESQKKCGGKSWIFGSPDWKKNITTTYKVSCSPLPGCQWQLKV